MTEKFSAFLSDHSCVVAPRLLGSVLHGPNGSGRIVEVEAYGGAEDPASHGHNGVTNRTKTVFGPTGFLYVYLIYGMHNCANVVTGPEDEGHAVLIRALEPLDVTPEMKTARAKAKKEVDIANGPGKLCQALGIDRSHDGLDLLGQASPVRLDIGEPIGLDNIVATTRVGISKAVEKPWRFYIGNNPWVSKVAGPK